MDKWFNEKLDRINVRKHTMHRISEHNTFLQEVYRKLSITNWIIFLNVFIYFLVMIILVSGMSEEKLLSLIALKANNFFGGAFWTPLTSMFVHIWLPHLFFNMISLFFIGNFLEKLIGRKKYIMFYLLAGIFAGIFYATLSSLFGNTELGAKIFVSPDANAVGASGAIFGIAGLLAVLTPFMKVYLIAGPLIAIIGQAILSSLFKNIPGLPVISVLITIYIFISIFVMFSYSPAIRRIALPLAMQFYILPIIAIVPLVIIGVFVPLPIGNTAHLGGLIVGIAYGLYLKKRYKKKTEMIRQYFRE